MTTKLIKLDSAGSCLFPTSLGQSAFQRFDDSPGFAMDSFDVSAQGYGSLVGLAYSCPAHSDGWFDYNLQIPAFTSKDIENLSALIRSMLSASQYEQVLEYERTHASAGISYWAFWSGGGSASYEKVHSEMRGFGLSEDNIKTIINAMAEVAKKMSSVALRFHVMNGGNDFAVSGNLLLYTIAGTIKTEQSQRQYRVLANKGLAGSQASNAPFECEVIPLNG